MQEELVSPSYKEGSALEIPPVHIRNDMALISSCSPCHRHMSLNSYQDMCRGSWDALGPLWDMCRGGLGPSWGSFGDALAPPWEHLEALLGHLEASWDMCRAPWGAPWRMSSLKMRKNLFFGAISGPKMEANFAS